MASMVLCMRAAKALARLRLRRLARALADRQNYQFSHFSAVQWVTLFILRILIYRLWAIITITSLFFLEAGSLLILSMSVASSF